MDAPVFKVSFRHIVVALIVHIIEDPILQDEIGGKIVDVGICLVEEPAHGLYLFQTGGRQAVLQNQLIDRVAPDVIL